MLITGAAGTVGSALARQILRTPNANLILVDRDENALKQVESGLDPALSTAFTSDLSQTSDLLDLLAGVDTVFHCAASKHVSFGEINPLQCFRDNVTSLDSIISASQLSGVRRIVFTSSDKAVAPTTVMGSLKLVSERLLLSRIERSESDLSCGIVRFGNILGSNGSVVPLMRDRVRNGSPLTITDPLMTRLVMTERDAVELTLFAASSKHKNAVIVPKMKSLLIRDLFVAMAFAFIGEHVLSTPPEHLTEDVVDECYAELIANGHLKELGAHPSEKHWESLLNSNEAARDLTEFPAAIVERPTLSERSDEPARGQYDSRFASKATIAEIVPILSNHETDGSLISSS